ncbi:MAG: hypothetical protein LUF85_02375 [Bacteroides sp.]|nr:hypothetical protein [Bacteroides sp.]
MMIITHFLKSKEEEYYKQAQEKDDTYKKKEIRASIESAKAIPVGCCIPLEFIHKLFSIPRLACESLPG